MFFKDARQNVMSVNALYLFLLWLCIVYRQFSYMSLANYEVKMTKSTVAKIITATLGLFNFKIICFQSKSEAGVV